MAGPELVDAVAEPELGVLAPEETGAVEVMDPVLPVAVTVVKVQEPEPEQPSVVEAEVTGTVPGVPLVTGGVTKGTVAGMEGTEALPEAEPVQVVQTTTVAVVVTDAVTGTAGVLEVARPLVVVQYAGMEVTVTVT